MYDLRIDTSFRRTRAGNAQEELWPRLWYDSLSFDCTLTFAYRSTLHCTLHREYDLPKVGTAETFNH
jgi:hypothetical protein